MSVCASDSATFKSVLGDSGRYVSGTTVWDRRLTGRMYNEDGSSFIHYFPFTVRIIFYVAIDPLELENEFRIRIKIQFA
jgi:hypothetical protein